MRTATSTDLDGLLQVALEQARLYPHLNADPEKIRALLRETLSSAQGFARVIERDGQIQSGLLAQSAPHGWARKSMSQILLWWSGCPGDGRALLRAYREWVAGRPVIRVAGLYVDFEAPPGLWRLLEREGFKRCGGSAQWIRGMS